MWESLFKKAMQILGSANIPPGDWTFGGGTTLTIRYRHRESYDIDIFIPDTQQLTFLTPRLNRSIDEIVVNIGRFHRIAIRKLTKIQHRAISHTPFQGHFINGQSLGTAIHIMFIFVKQIKLLGPQSVFSQFWDNSVDPLPLSC